MLSNSAVPLVLWKWTKDLPVPRSPFSCHPICDIQVECLRYFGCFRPYTFFPYQTSIVLSPRSMTEWHHERKPDDARAKDDRQKRHVYKGRFQKEFSCLEIAGPQERHHCDKRGCNHAHIKEDKKLECLRSI